MTSRERYGWRLSPSQQALQEAILGRISETRGPRRPFLLTGEPGVGKTLLARRLAGGGGDYHSLASDHWPELLAQHTLRDLTPEAVVRHVGTLAEAGRSPFTVADGLEPLLGMWAAERPIALPNFFLSLSRTIIGRPLLVVVQTSACVPHKTLCRDEWWPWERRFRLELTVADKETVAENWGLDPVRAQVSANLYELLASRLGGRV